MGRVVVVTGVGTEVGKTTLGVALVRGLVARGARVCGYKPVESGLAPGVLGDAAALDEAGTFHVKPTPHYGFPEPISPHLAAERAGVTIDLGAIADVVATTRAAVDLLLVELAGGLFTPLGPEHDNASLLDALRPDEALLVVPDALGALHHARAAELAARARSLGPLHLVLVEPGRPDASTGTNARPLRRLFSSTHHVPWRAGSAALSADDVQPLLDVCLP